MLILLAVELFFFEMTCPPMAWCPAARRENTAECLPHGPWVPAKRKRQGSHYHRANGGTLAVAPLKINPIYTLHSGYLLARYIPFQRAQGSQQLVLVWCSESKKHHDPNGGEKWYGRIGKINYIPTKQTQVDRLSHEKNPLLSIEYWLLSRDPYFMAYEIIPIKLGRKVHSL